MRLPEAVMGRVTSLDFLKGLLLYFVILVHVLQGTVQDSLVQYIIHSFAMPLFIGLSGYLYNFEKLIRTPKAACVSLLKTIVLPWLAACLFYGAAVNHAAFLRGDYGLFFRGIGHSLIYSYFHLWYVWGYLSYIFTVYLMIRLRLSDRVKVFLSMAISFTVCYFYIFLSDAPFGLRVFLNNFRMYNLIFFLTGYLMRAYKKYLRLSFWNTALVALLFLLNTVVGFFLMPLPALHYTLKFFLFYGGNILLILFTITLCVNFPHIRSSILKKIEDWGKNSLFVYLYHAFPILLIRHWMPVANFFYYAAHILSLAAMMLLLRFSRRFPFLRYISWI